LLDTKEGHHIYFEQCGNSIGQPVVFLHGGPGSGSNSNQRRFFDPSHYRIILLDQRGCGRSKPLGCITDNTIDHLVTDLEKIRIHLEVEQWLVFGGSWGSTLGLAYALAYPCRVTRLILRGIFLSRPKELEWFLNDVKYFYPEPWEKLLAFLEPAERVDMLSAYASRIFSDDPSINLPAATNWNAYENSIMSLRPNASNGSPVAADIQLARARVQLHYILHGCFIGQRDLLQEVGALASIPTTIIQGRYDMVCPPLTAWQLSRAMPHAEFHVIPDAGHSAMEPGTMAALISATERAKT
jgi:proline iminopeptidase